MQLQLIRNATMKFEYAGHHFLTDPFLAAKHTRPTYAGKSPNPLVDLPCTPQEILDGMEMVIISHLHSDHFDPAAQELLPKEMPIFCQAGDKEKIAAKGFSNVTPIADSIVWEGITITRVNGQHGSGDVLQDMGNASGFILQAENEPTVFWAGDTIWTESIADTIARVQPQVIITHSCGAVWGDNVLIVMDATQTVEVCRASKNGVVVAIHMDALDHATVSRQELRAYAGENGIGADKLLIPADGEKLFW
jgi:L-ascorbate metabolism protein UlaG (beta-lactamase superfamily)